MSNVPVSAEAFHTAVFLAFMLGFMVGGVLAIFVCTGKPRV